MNLSKKQGESKDVERRTQCVDCGDIFTAHGRLIDRCVVCAPAKPDSHVQQISVEKPEPELPSNVIAVDFQRGRK